MRNSRALVTGTSRTTTPRSATASSTALAIAAAPGMAPLSPTPLTPSGLIAEGCASRGTARRRLDRRVREPAPADVAGRHAGDEGPARLDLHVFGGALEQLGGDARGPRAYLARGACDGGAGVGHDAAPARAHAEREERRVTRAHDHVLERRPQLGRRDLGERGRMTLTLRRDPDQNVHLAARVDAHGRALVGSEPGPLRVAGEAEADAARRAGLGGLAPS